MASPSSSGSVSAFELPFPRALRGELNRHALLDQITARFEVRTEAVSIDGRIFPILTVRDTNVLLNAIDPADFGIDERLPYWAELWPSSIELARYCLQSRPYRGMRVLELGCGVGLAGIAAAVSGAVVTMTDFEEDALLFARWNAAVNLQSGAMRRNVRIRHMDWRSPGGAGDFDAVIGSDILYERRSFDPILDVLVGHLTANGCAAFTDPGRRTGVEFGLRAEERGFVVRSERRSLERGGRTQAITTFFLRRKGS